MRIRYSYEYTYVLVYILVRAYTGIQSSGLGRASVPSWNCFALIACLPANGSEYAPQGPGPMAVDALSAFTRYVYELLHGRGGGGVKWPESPQKEERRRLGHLVLACDQSHVSGRLPTLVAVVCVLHCA